MAVPNPAGEPEEWPPLSVVWAEAANIAEHVRMPKAFFSVEIVFIFKKFGCCKIMTTIPPTDDFVAITVTTGDAKRYYIIHKSLKYNKINLCFLSIGSFL